jgi:uncharacterized DUF497 family protein
MPWWQIIWTDESISKVAEHGLTQDDVEQVMEDPTSIELVSRSTGRPLMVGRNRGGRELVVVFERLDDMTALIITAYPLR